MPNEEAVEVQDHGVNDVDDLLEVVSDEGEEKQDDPKAEKEAEVKETPEEKPSGEAEKKAEIVPDELQKQIQELERKNKGLLKDLHKERQAKKASATKEPEVPLNREQLIQIIKESDGDPETLIKVLEYQASQTAKAVKAEALDEVSVNNNKANLENMVYSRYPQLLEPDSEMRTTIDNVAEKLGLSNNPYKDYLATGAKLLEDLPSVIKQAYEKGKADANIEGAEAKRKESISKSKLTPTGERASKADGGSLTATEKETAVLMDLSPSQKKIYEQLKSKDKKRSVSVED
jgi:hypothetical protein